MLPIALLAGGMGKRLGAVTEKTPKSLIEIEGRPFIEYQLKGFAKAGFSHVVICVGNLSERIIDFVGNGKRFGLQISYSHDGEHQLGTGGALKKALPLLGGNFFVQYGDSFLNFNYQKLEREFLRNLNPCQMAIYENRNDYDVSNVKICEGERINYSKTSPKLDMTFIDYGCMILEIKAFEDYEAPENFDLSKYLESLSESGLLRGYQVQDRFFEIGSSQGIQAFKEHVRNHPNEF